MAPEVALEVHSSFLGPWTLVKLEGELDSATDLVLKTFIGNLLDAGRINVALDLAQLTFADSSGLSVFLESGQRLERQGGRLALVSPRGIVRRVLEITGLYGAFDVHGSLSTLPMSIPEMVDGTEAEAPPESWVG